MKKAILSVLGKILRARQIRPGGKQCPPAPIHQEPVRIISLIAMPTSHRRAFREMKKKPAVNKGGCALHLL